MKNLHYILLFFLMLSCASIRVNYDYEIATDFYKYKTYNYYSNINSGLSELDTKRLLDALDSGLQAKGINLSDTPDFYVDIKSNEYKEVQNSSVGVGVGGTGGNVGGGISVGIPIGQSNFNRIIQFDFVDENGSGLFWQATSESSFSANSTPEQKETMFRAIVAKVLKGFPPINK